MKKISIFAVLRFYKGQNDLSIVVGFFYAHTANIRQFIPCVHCNGVRSLSLVEVLAAGNELPFFFQLCNILNSFQIMLRQNEGSLNGCIIPRSNRIANETGILSFNDILSLADVLTLTDILPLVQERFEVEKNEKNELYSFLIYCGLMNQFMSYKEKQKQEL